MLGMSAGVVTALAGGILFGPGLAESGASSHWDAPIVVTDPQIDATDMYTFTSADRSDTVTGVANYYRFQAYNLPYHFATDTRYDMNIDSRGDGKLGYLGGDRQGFPNGRRLTDDPTVAMLSMLQGGLLTPGLPGVGDDVMGAEAQTPPGKQFPYIPAPLHL
ncbi:MAG: hypothetical protein QOI83_60 [Streptomycetaceae bacterium]|nr:hypothetical protein [Streptomycetaceae bacterium]